MKDSKNAIKTKILFVEDDQGLTSVFQMRMEAEGFTVMSCSDVESAVRVGRDLKPDLILLDLMMPKVDGFTAITLFRDMKETKAAKIIIMSALSHQTDIDRATSLGADDYIVKSQLTIDDIMGRLRSALKLPPSVLSPESLNG